MRYISLFFFVGAIGISSVAAGPEDGGQSDPAAAAPSEQATGDLYAGRALAAKYCSICHLEPAPAILPKRSWEPLLGYMGYHLGITDISYLASHPPYVMPNVETSIGFCSAILRFPTTLFSNQMSGLPCAATIWPMRRPPRYRSWEHRH